VLVIKTIHLLTIEGYKSPSGYRIVKIQKLSDGSYEVTIEPLSWYL
jgi:hypothetical protein